MPQLFVGQLGPEYGSSGACPSHVWSPTLPAQRPPEMLGETSDAAAPKVPGLPRRAVLLGIVLEASMDQEDGFPETQITYRYGHRRLWMADPARESSC